jgi:hypothetical protein
MQTPWVVPLSINCTSVTVRSRKSFTGNCDWGTVEHVLSFAFPGLQGRLDLIDRYVEALVERESLVRSHICEQHACHKPRGSFLIRGGETSGYVGSCEVQFRIHRDADDKAVPD